MAFKFVILSALLAVASAGLISGPVTYAAAPVIAKIANPAVDAVAATHENVVRSYDGTISTQSKAIHTPYSSVHKEDTRISNNVYTPTIAKTVTYATPAQVYHQPAPVYHQPAPVYHQPAPVYHHSAPTPVYTHATPIVSKTLYTAPAPTPAVYEQHEEVPTAAVYTHAAPAIAKTVTYAAPAVAKTVTYAAPAVAKTFTYAAPASVAKHVEYAAPVTTTYNHAPAASTYAHSAPGISAYGSSQTVHYSPAEMVSHMSFDGFGTHWGWGL